MGMMMSPRLLRRAVYSGDLRQFSSSARLRDCALKAKSNRSPKKGTVPTSASSAILPSMWSWIDAGAPSRRATCSA